MAASRSDPSRAAGDSPLALAVRLAPYWESWGQFDAGRATLARALEVADHDVRERAAAMGALASLAAAQGDLHAARSAQEEAVRLYDDLLDRSAAASARVSLAMTLCRLGELGAADALAARARADLAGPGDEKRLAFARSAAGLVASARGRREEAIEELVASLAGFRAQGAEREAASVLVNLANLAHDAGDHRRAVRWFDGALQAFERLGDDRGAALCSNNLSLLAIARGDVDHAAELATAAVDRFSRAGDRRGEAAARNNLAGLWESQGATDTAASLYQTAAALFAAAGDEAGQRMAEENLRQLRTPTNELSPRECEVAALVAAGLSNRQIAECLFISQRTVDSHLAHSFTKLGVRSRTQLALWAVRAGLGPPDGRLRA